MKKTRTKLLSVLIVLCMVLTLLPMAALADDAQFTDMPDNYSTAALQAAVQNGLLKGANGKLRPAANLTRAEMATILNHAFGAAEKGDISGYTDVPAGAWYANEMAVATHMKTMVGNGKKLNPNAPITRQEALTALASVLNLPAGSDSVLANYKDNAKVASWARGSVAAMVAAGYATGDGVNLNPTAKITRADFAVIMNSIVKTYITKAGTYTENITGSVMVNVPGVILKNITITGNLIIGDGVGSGDVTLDGVTVTGKTIVRGGGVHSVKIINNSNVGTLTISKVDGEVRVAADASSKVDVVVINDGKDDVIVEGNVAKLEVAAAGVPVTVQGGTVGEVSVTAAHAQVTVASTATVTTLTATGAQPTVTVQGTVTTLTADKTATGATVTVAKGAKVGTVNAAAEGTAVTGEGTVTNANVTGNNVNVATSGTSVTVATGVTGAKSGDKDLKGGTTTTTSGTSSSTQGGFGGSTVDSSIIAAPLVDHADTPQTTLYDANSYSVTGYSDGRIAIRAQNVVKHTNGVRKPGYWVGAAIEVPADIASKDDWSGIKYSFGTAKQDPATSGLVKSTEAYVVGGKTYLAFYADAGSTAPKTYIAIDWDGDGTNYTTRNYHIDLSGVRWTEVMPAGCLCASCAWFYDGKRHCTGCETADENL